MRRTPQSCGAMATGKTRWTVSPSDAQLGESSETSSQRSTGPWNDRQRQSPMYASRR